jgi:hypothetical protein
MSINPYPWAAPLEEVPRKPEWREEGLWRGGNAAVH